MIDGSQYYSKEILRNLSPPGRYDFYRLRELDVGDHEIENWGL